MTRLFNFNLFQSKLALRIFGMFVLCALVPIVVLTLISFGHVTDQLKGQAFNRLEQLAKAQALSIYEHLLFIETELKLVQASLNNTENDIDHCIPNNRVHNHSERLNWLVLHRRGNYTPILGNSVPASPLSPSQIAATPVNTSLLHTVYKVGGEPDICIAQPITLDDFDDACLTGEINSRFLWGLGRGTILPDGTEFYVLDHKGRQLFGTLPNKFDITKHHLQKMDQMPSGHTELIIDGKTLYAGYWSFSLMPRFQLPFWTVIVLEPQDHVLIPIAKFSNIFPLIIGMTLLMVIFLCSYAIRKTLGPIESLMEGARQVALNQFSYRVQTTSDDEFKDMANAFNQMSAQVEKQFKRLTARSELDRVILSLLDNEKIVSEVLNRLSEFFPHHTCGISILDSESLTHGQTYIRSAADGGAMTTAMCRLSRTDVLRLDQNQTWLEIDTTGTFMDYLRPMLSNDVAKFIIFPVWVHQQLFALVSLGIHKDTVYGTEDLLQIRQLANQLAVAFSNTSLIKELKDLNMGTLFALGRTVDAKSSWTAGHSARVMRIARAVGRHMGLSSEELEDLNRAALLHDIGKIGVPFEILSKQDSLTPAEYDIVKTHPSIGVRILSPIKAYQNLLPIIEQHHERFDGNGYPLMIAGQEIHLSARILAVADTYDAMVSDRPYRNGISEEQAVDLIFKDSGAQFDPEVVEAFLCIMMKQSSRLGDRRPIKLQTSAPEHRTELSN